MNLEQVSTLLTSLNDTLGSGDLNRITKDFTSLANINVTPEMVADARKKLHLEQLSTQNLEQLSKIFIERQKLLLQRVQILANCAKTGFKNVEERTKVMMGVLVAFNGFKSIMTEMGFNADSNAQQANNFMASYRR